MATGSLLGLVVIVVVFLLAVVMAALLLAGKFAKKKAVPVYVDDDPRDNIMPYHDEGTLSHSYVSTEEKAGKRADSFFKIKFKLVLQIKKQSRK